MGFTHKLGTVLGFLQGFLGPNALPNSRATLLWTWLRLRMSAKRSHASGTHRVLNYRVTTDDPAALAYLFFEVFAVQEYAFTAASKAPFIIDLGGNIGMATLYFKSLYPEATIHTFEPSPATFRLLETNVRENGLGGVTLHHAAVAGEEGELEFYTDPTRGASMVASLRPERSVQFVHGSEAANADLANSGKVKVKAVRLSSLLDHDVDFLKMDIEGAEQQVLEELAASGTLRRIRAMAIEYHHHIAPKDDALAKFLRILEEHGFGYQLRAPLRDLAARDAFQDVLIVAYRRDRNGA